MRKKLLLIRKITDIVIWLSALFFTVINFDNITYYFSMTTTDATMSLNARYHNWLMKKYYYMGLENPRFTIEHWTMDNINSGVNVILFVIITIMMIVSFYWRKDDKSKLSRKHRVYCIAFFIFMFVITFFASPAYVSDALDE